MNKKTIIAAASLLVGILLFVALVVLPLLQAIRKDSANLEAQYAGLLKASSAEKEVAEFLKLSQARHEDFEKIENIFVDAQTPVAFIRFIEEIAAASGLAVRITPGSAEKEKGIPWPVMDFQLASSGNYSSLLRFLEKLENGPFLISLQNTTVTRSRTSPEQQSSQDVNITLLLRVFTGPLSSAL